MLCVLSKVLCFPLCDLPIVPNHVSMGIPCQLEMLHPWNFEQCLHSANACSIFLHIAAATPQSFKPDPWSPHVSSDMFSSS